MKRYVLLDVYKFVFIVIIALGHLLQYFTINEYQRYQFVISRSYVFVEFFFLVSGFLLGNKLLSKEHDYNERSVFLQRIKSLYPDYLLSTIICGIVMLWAGTKTIRQVFFAWCCELTFVNSLGIDFHWTNGPAWFISALMCATLILILLIKCLKKIWNVEIVPVLLIALGVCCYGYIERVCQSGIGFTLTDHIERQLLPLGTIRAIGGVSIGIGLNRIYYMRQRLDRIKSTVLSILGIGLISFVLFSKSLFEESRFQCEMVMVLGFILLIFGALRVYREPNFIEKTISQYSMTIFLNHYAVAIFLPHIFGSAGENYAKLIPLFIIVTIALSALEKKLSKYIKYKIFDLSSRCQPQEKV